MRRASARKVTETQAGACKNERRYLGGCEIYREYSGGAGLRVDAFDRDLGSRHIPLGDAAHPVVTSEDGVFPTIRCRTREFAEVVNR